MAYIPQKACLCFHFKDDYNRLLSSLASPNPKTVSAVQVLNAK